MQIRIAEATCWRSDEKQKGYYHYLLADQAPNNQVSGYFFLEIPLDKYDFV